MAACCDNDVNDVNAHHIESKIASFREYIGYITTLVNWTQNLVAIVEHTALTVNEEWNKIRGLDYL